MMGLLTVIDPHLVAVARAAKGFIPTTKAVSLHDAAIELRSQSGDRCSRSARIAASRPSTSARRSCHRDDPVHCRSSSGSEENQAGWEHHDDDVVDPRTGRMNTFRSPTDDGRPPGSKMCGRGVGYSLPVARNWRRSFGFLFIDGGTPSTWRWATTKAGRAI